MRVLKEAADKPYVLVCNKAQCIDLGASDPTALLGKAAAESSKIEALKATCIDLADQS